MFRGGASGDAGDSSSSGMEQAMAEGSPSGQSGRVDLRRVLSGLRHLTGSTEPGRVFAELAVVCVPALCDEIVIDIEEAGGHRYRIRQPSTASARRSDELLAQGAPGQATISGQSIHVFVTSLFGGGPECIARLTCFWNPDYLPTDVDAGLVGVLADHLAAVLHRERTIGSAAGSAAVPQASTDIAQQRVVDSHPALAHIADAHLADRHGVDAHPADAQRVAAATSILIALHHLGPARARQLLASAGDRTRRALLDVAVAASPAGGYLRPAPTVANGPADHRSYSWADSPRPDPGDSGDSKEVQLVRGFGTRSGGVSDDVQVSAGNVEHIAVEFEVADDVRPDHLAF
jgi:hypothetical protein